MSRRVLLAAALALWSSSALAQTRLLNASYDPTRELYADVNRAFAGRWKAETGQDIAIDMSHGGSGDQARAVAAGLQADVVTLGLTYDVDELADRKLIAENWRTRLPNNSSPYTSTVIFVVRKGNPDNIKDWPDLIRRDVRVITANPKTSGGARWNYLAAWGYAMRARGHDEARAREFVQLLYRNVPILTAGARESTISFVERRQGTVLLTWENEALLALKQAGKEDRFEIVVPSISILAEPPVAVVDQVVDRRGTRAAAEAYLRFLYTAEGQELAARHFYRPRLKEAADRHAGQFPRVELFTVEQMFGSWRAAQSRHFAENGVFDQISRAR
jgi:sulfate transport system substrate-binding protein